MYFGWVEMIAFRRPAFASLMGLLALAVPAAADTQPGMIDGCAPKVGMRAIAACTRLIQSDRSASADVAAALVNRGTAYDESGQHIRAIRDFDEAIRLKPNDAVAFNERGFAYLGLGQFSRAVADYDRAVALGPDFAEAYNNRGVAYNQMGLWGRTIDDFNQAIQLNPNYAEAFNNRGYARNHLNQFMGAIYDLDTAIKLKPDYFEAFYNRGISYIHLGQYPRALQDFDEAARLNPAYLDAVYGRATAHAHMGDYALAVADYTRVIAARPGDAEAYNGRCFARAGWGQELEGALADCNRSLHLVPGNADTLDSRALVDFRLGRFGDVLADTDAALKIDGNKASSLYIRGLAKLRGGLGGGKADIATATAMDATVATMFTGYGVAP
jgi:tetratricopeptide (TPR) repeat protein